ncbi:MAG: sigma 54-interacting transcriptional regulator [Polyangiales bacterium]
MRAPASAPSSSNPRSQPAGPAPEVLLAVADVGRALGASIELDERLARALRAMERRLGATRAVLVTVAEDATRFRIQAIHGMSADQFRPQLGAGVVGRVVSSGQPVVVPVVRHDPMALSELTELPRWNDAGWNLVSLPVASAAGTPIGALSAYFRHRDGNGFADRLSALEVIAGLMGNAMRAKQPADFVRSPDEGSHTQPPTAASDHADQAPSDRPPTAAFEYTNMVGESPVMRQLYEQIGQVARTNATALLRGESGTGKEVVAHAIHHNSPRSEGAFVKVNCAALPDSLFESELFGHERGAFTGAHSRKKGRFELAQGGTLFLDEIGELSAAAQAKLLRALQFREFERVGGTETLRSDVRIIAATNVDLERAVAGGSFREDLYYRINIFTIHVPPLRERRADIPALAQYFLQKWAVEHQRSKINRIASSALDALAGYTWPGNVRELENVIERAVVVCTGSMIQEQHLPHALRAHGAGTERLTLTEAVEKLERQMIGDALQAAGGNMAAAARALGTTERVVRYKAQKLGLEGSRSKR